MTNPLHVLRHEHRVIEQVVRALYGICLRLEWGEQIAPEALASLVDFTGAFVDRFHHGKEENYLFPALERRGILSEPLEAMAAEHRLENELTEGLDRALAAYRQGNAAAARGFVEAARSYADHLLGHMQREDYLLLRLADELLGEQDKALLMQEFRRARQEFGDDGKYERIASELEATWSV